MSILRVGDRVKTLDTFERVGEVVAVDVGDDDYVAVAIDGEPRDEPYHYSYSELEKFQES